MKQEVERDLQAMKLDPLAGLLVERPDAHVSSGYDCVLELKTRTTPHEDAGLAS